MRLTTMSRYATSAVFDIAYNSVGFPIQVRDISNRQGIPLKFLELIFHKLKKGNIVESVKGPYGGYLLARDPDKITVRDIIEALKEPIDVVYCVSDATSCARATQCITRLVWKEAAEIIDQFFASISIDDLCEIGKDIGTKRYNKQGCEKTMIEELSR